MTYDERRYRSVSQLKTFTDCGEAFRIMKVEKIQGKPAAWTVRGIAVHDTIEEWERSSRSIDPVKYLQDQAWPKALEKCIKDYPDVDNWLRTPMVKTTKRDLELREKEAPEHVSIYCDRAIREEDIWRVWQPLNDLPWDTLNDLPVDTPPAVEVEFKLEYPDLWIVGWIDQIIEWYGGETYTVKDIKSGRDSKEDNRQLGLYAIAANKMFGLGITQGCYWYTKLDKDTGLKDLSIYTEEYLHACYSMLDSGIKHEIFLPNPEREKCTKFCGVRDYCREWNQGV